MRHTRLHSTLLFETDCFLWYVSDALFIIAKYLAKAKNAIKKDKGAPEVYHEMIQTWVTYELVKVIYIFGLNPEPNEFLSECTPEIRDYTLNI
jgi:hypothetical protein